MISEKKTFEERDCIHVYSPGTIKINFHQISHGAFCWRDTVNLLKGSALLNKIGTMPLHGKNTVHYFFPRTKKGFSLTLCCVVVYSTRQFVVCLSVCHFVLVFFSPFSIAITSLGEERATLSAFLTFVRFVLV